MPIELPLRIRGCLLGGACGDALGAPVEFLSLSAIRKRYGRDGIAELDSAYGRVGAITDDTQMTLFTAEGLIRAAVAAHGPEGAAWSAALHRAYLRWYLTQGGRPAATFALKHDGWLLGIEALWDRRAPGNTCLSALDAARSLGAPARNDSKGCGGVMRAAPAGLLGLDVAASFALGADLAHLTHGHPSGYLAAGHLAATLAALVEGAALPAALDAATAELKRHQDAAETLNALTTARLLASDGRQPKLPAVLGEGWVAEEALAIAVWCALVGSDTADAIRLAVNHDGDSDSTGSIAGQILGTLHGPSVLPAAWLDRLELRSEIERLAGDLALVATGQPADLERLAADYPA